MKRKMSDAARKHKSEYDTGYILKNIVQKRISFNKTNPDDMKRLAHVEKQPNQTQYFKDMIDKDMGSGK